MDGWDGCCYPSCSPPMSNSEVLETPRSECNSKVLETPRSEYSAWLFPSPRAPVISEDLPLCRDFDTSSSSKTEAQTANAAVSKCELHRPPFLPEPLPMSHTGDRLTRPPFLPPECLLPQCDHEALTRAMHGNVAVVTCRVHSALLAEKLPHALHRLNITLSRLAGQVLCALLKFAVISLADKALRLPYSRACGIAILAAMAPVAKCCVDAANVVILIAPLVCAACLAIHRHVGHKLRVGMCTEFTKGTCQGFQLNTRSLFLAPVVVHVCCVAASIALGFVGEE